MMFELVTASVLTIASSNWFILMPLMPKSGIQFSEEYGNVCVVNDGETVERIAVDFEGYRILRSSDKIVPCKKQPCDDDCYGPKIS